MFVLEDIMNTIVSLLLLIVCSSFRDSSDFSIAMTLLKNLNSLDKINKNTFLEEAGVSNHSLMRFCDMLGYKNFTNLKLAITQTSNIRKQQMREHHDNKDNQSLLNHISFLCNSTFDEKAFMNSIKNINELIFESKKVMIVGAVYPEILCLHYMEDMLMMDKLIYSVPLKMDIHDEDTVVILISLTGRVYIEHYDEIKSLIKSGISIIGIGNQNTVPQGIQLKEFLSLPFVGDVEVENGAIPLIMQYLKYDYLCRFIKGGVLRCLSMKTSGPLSKTHLYIPQIVVSHNICY